MVRRVVPFPDRPILTQDTCRPDVSGLAVLGHLDVFLTHGILGKAFQRTKEANLWRLRSILVDLVTVVLSKIGLRDDVRTYV